MNSHKPQWMPDKSIVLIGLMGAGKSCIGRRIAKILAMPFYDSDHEIEAAANLSISDIFTHYGEPAFRDCERRVMARLLDGPPCVLASGGGAYMNEETRSLVQQRAVSLWLRADLDLLVSRTAGRTHRPILQTGNPRDILARLIDERYPIYSSASLIVDSENISADITARTVVELLHDYFMDQEKG